MIKFRDIKQLCDDISVYEIYEKMSMRLIEGAPESQILADIHNCRFAWKDLRRFTSECNKTLYIRFRNMTYKFYYQDVIKVPFSRVLQMIKYTLIICHYFKMYHSFNFHIFLYDKKRKLSNGIVSPENINGGYTYTSGNNIFILRQEEFIKTIIHEILHHCPIIHNETFTSDDLNRLRETFQISAATNLAPNEAIVELWATVLFCMLMSCDTNISWKILYNIEVQHSIVQSNKLLNKHKQMKKWYETTNSYCYIVFKTILLLNYDKLMKRYTFPYNSRYITDFLIQNKTIPFVKVDKNTSLRMMKLSN